MTEAVSELTTEPVQKARDKAIRAVTDIVFGESQEITPGIAHFHGQVVDAVVTAYRVLATERLMVVSSGGPQESEDIPTVVFESEADDV